MNLIKSHKRIIVLPPQSEIPRRTIEQSMTLSLYIDSIYSSSEDLLLVYRGVNATQPTVFLQLRVIFFFSEKHYSGAVQFGFYYRVFGHTHKLFLCHFREIDLFS